MPDDIRSQIMEQSKSGFFRMGVIEARAAEDGEEDRRVEFALSSEDPVERWFGPEVLVHTKKAIDLEFMASGRAPLLLQHDHDVQIGVVEKVTLGKDRKLRALARFSKSAKASEVLADIRDGIRVNVSVGYRIRDIEVIRDDDENIEEVRVIDWYPFEASIVSVPADISVGVGRAHNLENHQSQRTVTMPDQIPAQTVDVARVAREAANHAAEQARQEAEARAAEAATTAAARAEEVAQARQTEVADIMELGARFDMSAEARAHVDAGGSLSVFRGLVLDKQGDDTPLAPSQNIGMSEREIGRFSVIRLLRASTRGADRSALDAASFELEACAAAAENSTSQRNGMTLPAEVMDNWLTPAMQRAMGVVPQDQVRTLLAGTDTALIPTEHRSQSFIELLRTNAVLMQAGMRVLSDLSGNVDIPRQSVASTITWISAEHGDSTDSEPQYDTVSLTPKDVSVSVPISRRMRQQSSPAIEALVRMDILMGMALAIDLAGIEGSGAAGQPTGVLNTAGVNAPTSFAAVNPTWAEVVAMETAVADDNALMGSLAYIGRTNMRGALKTTLKDPGSGQFVMPEAGTLNGYPYLASNQITDGNLYFGNWNDLLMGMWSGLDLVFDDATLAAKNGLYIRAFQTVDFAVRHAESFAFNNDGI